MIKTSAAWFREVSGGRYSVSGVVTPWLRVRRPSNCLNGANNVGNQALAAAQRRGYRLASFERFILVMPCRPPSGILGFATLPGRTSCCSTWPRSSSSTSRATTSACSTLGTARQCVRGRRAVTWSRRCRVIEYGDAIDSMGNYRAGQYNSFYKARLGWLNSRATVTRSRTVRLAPVKQQRSWVQGDPAAGRPGHVLARVPDQDRRRRPTCPRLARASRSACRPDRGPNYSTSPAEQGWRPSLR